MSITDPRGGTVTSPVRGGVRILAPARPHATGWRSDTTLSIAADEPVFAGHYPGFPIFPGVCLVECVHRSALVTAPGADELDLCALESARFLSPVYPGDAVTVGIEWSPVADGWRCVAEVGGPRGVAALVRLRYHRTSNV